MRRSAARSRSSRRRGSTRSPPWPTSPATSLDNQIGGQGPPTTASRAASAVHVPALLAVARDDGFISLPDERALYERLGSTSKRLLVLPAPAGHGWDMLAERPFERTLTAFLLAHAERR